MTFDIDQIVPWGRSYEEYVSMFSLSADDLTGRFVDCGGGPASFTAALTSHGGDGIAVDPLYAFSADTIALRIATLTRTGNILASTPAGSRRKRTGYVGGLNHKSNDELNWNPYLAGIHSILETTMSTARKHTVVPGQPGFFHCVSRCVRRAWLCRTDPVSGNNYDHRHEWMLERMRLLTTCFAMDVYSYALMSNHYHIVFYIDPDRVDSWSDAEVIRKWKTLWSWRKSKREPDIPKKVCS